MPVLIKINSWRERENGNAIKKFKPEQSLILYNLSFKLADKFMLSKSEMIFNKQPFSFKYYSCIGIFSSRKRLLLRTLGKF